VKRRTRENWSFGLGTAANIANMIGQLYSGIAAANARSQGADAYNEWNQSLTQPAQMQPTGDPVTIEKPGGGTTSIPTFEMGEERRLPIDAAALSRLYASMAGLPPEVAAQYTGYGNTMYAAEAQRRAAEAARGMQLEDRAYERGVKEEERAFDTRSALAKAMGEDYRIVDPGGYLRFLETGEGDLSSTMEREPEEIKTLAPVLGKDGVLVPYVQGGEIGSKVLKTDEIELPDGTLRYQRRTGGGSGSGGARMTPAQRANLSAMQVERDVAATEVQRAQNELIMLKRAEQELQSSNLPAFSRDRKAQELTQARRKAEAKLTAAQKDHAVKDAKIKSWETGQVVGGGPVESGGGQPAPAKPNPWMRK